ncbi:hypothetical protein [Klenkia taihuensis]|uniref:Uncharacterized protein n=1 Tax=Klenkia taihuensis TaxID=1225127 RepID=A0A1I1HRN0_9ACTN|nr:hypothetical protein [Klenkia taihuensis]GHE09073.1 hypothetical protein GCM10011381_12210 [Klenkia taihuensis]SFC26212.1 hypothetical protein SAMN05661030_0515 [Klenkia taihuensis]
MTVEDQLRTALRHAADDLGEPVVPHRVLAAGLRLTAQRRRRRRLGSITVGVAVAAVVVAVPVGLGSLRTDPPTVAAPSTSAVDVLAGPTRGSLAGDQAFLDGLVQRGWGDVPADAPVAEVGSRRVVFAGDVGTGRWALVVGTNPAPSTLPAEQQTDLGAMSAVTGVWFVGPAGATPEEMQPVTYPRGLDPEQVQTLGDPLTGDVVVLAAPGDDVALSDRPEVRADGTVTRAWRQAEVTDGLAVDRFEVAAPTSTYSRAGHVRVTRDGIQVLDRSPDQFGPADGFTVVDVPIAYPRGRVEGPDVLDQDRAGDVLSLTGLPADQVRFEVVWSGAVPGPGDDPTWASFMVATLPSGARIVQGSDVRLLSAGTSATDAPTYGAGQSVFQVLPAGGPATDLVLPMEAAVSGNGGEGTVRSLVVAVPDGVTAVTALDEDGTTLATLVPSGGAAVGPFPDGTTSVAAAFPEGVVQTFPLGSYTGDL